MHFKKKTTTTKNKHNKTDNKKKQKNIYPTHAFEKIKLHTPRVFRPGCRHAVWQGWQPCSRHPPRQSRDVRRGNGLALSDLFFLYFFLYLCHLLSHCLIYLLFLLLLFVSMTCIFVCVFLFLCDEMLDVF